MAYAQSFQKGQFPVSCKLCLNEARISWKCQECDVLMCNRCKHTIHPNIKNAKNHTVLDIKDIGLQSENVVECQSDDVGQCQHKGRDCVMYCKSCDQLVCLLCISKVHIHSRHELVEISEGRHIERLKEGQSTLIDQLDLLTKHSIKIEEIKKSEKSKYLQTRKKIQSQNKALKKAVDQYTDKLAKELDQKWKIVMDFIKKEEARVVRSKKIKEDKNDQVEKILHSKDHDKIFEESKKFIETLKEELDLPEVEFNTIPQFLPGEICQENFGAFQNIPNNSFKVIKEFSTDISAVHFISPSLDSLWISNGDVVQNIQAEEHKVKVTSSFNFKVWGISITPSDDLLLISGGPALKILSGSTGEITDSVYNVQPLDITTVHVTSEYNIIVGAKSPGELFPVAGRSLVIVMDKEGRAKTSYEFDNHNQPLYKYPRSITTTQNGNICVVDCLTSDHRGRVVVSGMEGNVIDIYTGLPGIYKQFRPRSITTTPSDNIIIPDSKIIHILNSNGQLVTFINEGDGGIYKPYSVAFTITGKVYIGSTRPEGGTDNSKLYEVKIDGF